MKKITAAAVTAMLTVTILTGFKDNGVRFGELSFFPMFSTSPSVEYEQPETDCGRVVVVEQKERPQVKFKIVEWLEKLAELF